MLTTIPTSPHPEAAEQIPRPQTVPRGRRTPRRATQDLLPVETDVRLPMAAEPSIQAAHHAIRSSGFHTSSAGTVGWKLLCGASSRPRMAACDPEVQAGRVFAMSWGAEGIAQAASSEFQDVEAAAELLRASVDRAAVYGASHAAGAAYKDAAQMLAEDMCSEGRAALSAGRAWRRESGPVWVSLFPRDLPDDRAT